MPITLNIHFETFDKESFKRVLQLSEKGPIAISIAPFQLSRIPDSQIKKLKEILSRPGYILGQQGLNHKCSKCEDFHFVKRAGKIVKVGIDPWHENYCLWLGMIPEKEQYDLMKKGKEKLRRVFSKNPNLYVPPNHYFDIKTARVASMLGFKWLADRALIPLKPYNFEDVFVVPEGEPEIAEKGNSYVYIHADRWKGNLDNAVSTGLISFYDIKPSRNKHNFEENRKMKMTGKIFRDLNKGYGIQEKEARELAQLLYETKFINDPFL